MFRLKKARPFIVILLITLAAELLLFNYKAIFSLAYKQTDVSSYTVGGGLNKQDDGNLKMVRSGGYIEITDIGTNVRNLYLDVQIFNASGYDSTSIYNGKFDATQVIIYADDAANAQYQRLGYRNVLHKVKQSQYITLHLSGDTNNIKIQFDEAIGTVIHVYGISYNARVPFFISFGRIAVVWLALSVLYLLRPHSGAYAFVYDRKNIKQKAVKIIIAIGLISVFFKVVNSNPYFVVPRWDQHYQYQDLARAFAHGSVSLEDEPSAKLKAMDNPYDTDLRSRLNVDYRWDRSYYNGKYYVYFGVLPELIFYLPYYLATGEDFQTYIGIYIMGILLIAGTFYLLGSIVERWFKKTPFIIYMLAAVMMCTGCGALAIMMRPDFYSLPIITAVVLSLWGLGFWIRSIKEDGTLSKPLLAAGSICMALVSASRPQQLVVSFTAIALFFEPVFKKKILLLGKKYGNTIAFVTPYVVIAILVMYYNYIRFGSPIDYGANYNLTTNDMTQRGFVAGRTFLGIFSFLFQTPQTTAVFPFIQSISVNTSYMGTTISETLYGGILACNMWLWPVAAAFLGKTGIWKNKKALSMMRAMMIAGLVIMVADTQMAGVLARYVMDFCWIFFVAASIGVFALYEYISEHGSELVLRLWKYFMMIAFAEGMVYNFMRIFMSDTESIVESNPELYYRVMHIVAFWM